MSATIPPSVPPKRLRRQDSLQNDRGKVVLFAIIAFVSFLCFLGVLGLLIWKAEELVRLALIGNVYYPILVILGLCAAVFLFGVLQSYASYRGRHLGGNLQLGGPAVVFALVVVGAKAMIPNAEPFSVGIYVHGPMGLQDVVLQNSGEVVLTLDELTPEQIGNRGRAVFPAVPARFRGQEVQVFLKSDAYEIAHPDQKIRLVPSPIYLEIALRKCHVTVQVIDSGYRPIAGAEIRIESIPLGKSDAHGFLEKNLQLHSPYETPKLYVSAAGYETKAYTINPTGENQIEVALNRQK